MKGLIKKLLSYLAYTAAGGIILLAVAVGLFRLFLPRLPAHQEDIKAWATAAIGMEVDFSGMNARWRFSGPELNFYNAELLLTGEDSGALAADEVSVGIDLMQLLLDRAFVIDSVLVRDTAIDVGTDDTGRWLVQNIPLEVLSARFASGGNGGDISVVGEDIAVTYRHPPNGELINFTIDDLRLNRSAERLLIDAALVLPESLGNRLNIGIVGSGPRAVRDRVWQYGVDARDLNLAGWSSLQPADWPQIVSGNADVSMSIEQSSAVTRNAVVEFEVTNVANNAELPAFGAKGRVVYERDSDAWLLSADDVRLQTLRGTWPASSFKMQGEALADATLNDLSVIASFVNLDDLTELQPWLPDELARYLREYAPSGKVENLTLALTNMASTESDYEIALELADAGIQAGERLPGIRGFTGTMRADRSGGRVEMNAVDLELDLSRWLAQPVVLDSAQGTVIWRRNRDGIIVLSDDVALSNQDIVSHSNVQLSLPGDRSAPVLDLESRWSITDLREARRYLPRGIINPPLYSWLQSALVGGSIPGGTTRFSGPIDQFPFDNDEGVFRIEATLQDATLLYSDRWPAVENLDLDLIVDRTRLYSEKNTASNAGNLVVDAKIEIADLRKPVLTIESLSTGTLESIRRFVQQSPIADVFGGRLDEVSVAGDASFVLNLTYPIRDREAYEFTTRIQVSNGTVQIAGFPAPVSELNGIVNISRDDVDADSLFGRFLNESITIDLRPAGTEFPGSSVIVDVDGRVTAAGLAASLGLSLADVLEGGADYVAQLYFPRGASESPAPFNIAISSDTEGLAVLLPSPLSKARDDRQAFVGQVSFPADGVIETDGSLGDGVEWSLAFLRADARWDFDRGVLALGGASAGSADTRGLHVVGSLSELRLSDWLEVNPASGRRRGGMAARIRSLDIDVQSLYVLGQHFAEHHIDLDRSGNNWLVQIKGAEAQGSLAIPYDFASGRPLTADMEKLILPGSDEGAEESDISMDPRDLPPISLKAAEFGFGERYLGRVAAEFEVTPDGVLARQFTTEDKTFAIDGSAGWVIDTAEPAGQRTWVKARLTSSDVGATMQRLNSQPGIVGKDMEIDIDVSWPGGPREDFLGGLDGNVLVRFGTGQLDEVEPGAGRMFGLMSVVALPRRLALDFRDVLDKGFLFDEITGTFRVSDGNAFTCDLSLKGPAADVGIVGRVGLQAKDYSQTAVVSANVGNTLPVVGAVVAGPQVAAALLLFSRIFKKPLQEMGQAYYAIDGSWDDPQVEAANAARFAVVSREASCLPAQP